MREEVKNVVNCIKKVMEKHKGINLNEANYEQIIEGYTEGCRFMRQQQLLDIYDEATFIFLSIYASNITENNKLKNAIALDTSLEYCKQNEDEEVSVEEEKSSFLHELEEQKKLPSFKTMSEYFRNVTNKRTKNKQYVLVCTRQF